MGIIDKADSRPVPKSNQGYSAQGRSCNISPCPPKGGTNAEATTPSLPAGEL